MRLTNVANPHPLQEDSQGVIRVGQTRVTLKSVVDVFEQGASAEEIAIRFETLILGDVYAVLSFYLAHRPEVTAYLKAEAEESDRERKAAEARSPFKELRLRLRARESA